MPFEDRAGAIRVAVTFLMAFNHFDESLLQVPRKIFLENLICDEFYRQHATGDVTPLSRSELCKIPSIQKELATITGLQMLFDSIPPLIWGRYLVRWRNVRSLKRLVILAMLGELCSLLWTMLVYHLDGKWSVKRVWISSFFLLVGGGGSRILIATLNSIVINYVPPETRDRWIFLNPILESAVGVLAPYIANPMLKRQIWSTFGLAIVVSGLGFVIARIVLPGKLEGDVEVDNHQNTTAVTESQYGAVVEEGHVECSGAGSTVTSPLLNDRLLPERTNAGTVTSLGPKQSNLVNRKLKLCYLILFLKDFGFGSETFIYQHVSRNFNWSLRETTRLELAMGFGFGITMLASPVIYTFVGVTRRYWFKSLYITTGSVFEIAGFWLFWTAKSSLVLLIALIFCGLGGAGLGPTVKGIACQQLSLPKDIVQMFFEMVCYESSAQLVAGAFMFQFLHVGESNEGFSFFVSTFTFVITFIVTLFLLPVAQLGTETVEDDEESSITVVE